ncbi:MAG: PIG-L family deacetylase [Planctomycetota bacterium]
MRTLLRRALALAGIFIIVSLIISAAQAASRRTDHQQSASAADLAIALKKINTLGSVLYIAAHPDDENTAAITYFSKGRCYRAAYLSVTRGDGGQNLIGTEQGPHLGLLRTQELLAARRIDGGEQFFTRAIDFGYSKNPDETLRIWDREKVLSDMVWVIRTYRPDVIVNRFPKNGDGGHGHHTASAILGEEAFKAAADPKRFPEQLQFVETWQAKRLCWNTFRPQNSDRNGEETDTTQILKIDLGAYDPILGQSYTEIAGRSRSQHKSQGFGAPERRGSRVDNYYILGGEKAEKDVFDGIDTTWARVPGSEAVAELLASAEKQFHIREPKAIVPALIKAYGEMEKLAKNPWVDVKKRELLELIRGCAGLWLEATADRYQVSPGETLKITASALLRSGLDLSIEPGRITHGPSIEEKIVKLQENQAKRWDVSVKLPANAEVSGQYWLRSAPDAGVFPVANSQQIGTPESPDPVTATFTIRSGETKLEYIVPIIYRWVDPVQGELERPLEIAPKVTGRFDHEVYLFNNNAGRKLSIKLTPSGRAWKGSLQFKAPKGWAVSPETLAFEIKDSNADHNVFVTVTPLAGAENGIFTVGIADDGAAEAPLKSVVRISYPHIPTQTLFPDLEAKLVHANVKITGKQIGYIAGAGDEVADALQQMGFVVTLLSDADLESADLSVFDTIVAGVRAYNTRKSLKKVQSRLNQYVENGGTYVVQYCTASEADTSGMGPFSFTLGRERVTVEEADVRFEKPEHVILNTPNKITKDDFNNWIQERGLYFASKWDSKYETVLGMNDPGESNKLGSVLYTRHGKGVFVYTGISFFRQLPAGVPGAYRLFANIVSARGADTTNR